VLVLVLHGGVLHRSDRDGTACRCCVVVIVALIVALIVAVVVPVMYLQQLLSSANAAEEFRWRRRLRDDVDVASLVHVVTVAGTGTLDIGKLVARLGSRVELCRSAMAAMDELASHPSRVDASGTVSCCDVRGCRRPCCLSHCLALCFLVVTSSMMHSCVRRMRGGAARAFAIIAALLWRVAGWGGASASGPANGKDGVIAFDLIARAEPDRRREAVALLMRMRNEVSGHADAAEVPQTLWRATEVQRNAAALTSPRFVLQAIGRRHVAGRMARYYERAAHLMLAQCVATTPVRSGADAAHALKVAPLLRSRSDVDPTTGLTRTAVGQWVEATGVCLLVCLRCVTQ
jgi:hypothetical protein